MPQPGFLRQILVVRYLKTGSGPFHPKGAAKIGILSGYTDYLHKKANLTRDWLSMVCSLY